MKYTNEIVIDRPVDEVITLFDNPDNMYKWMDGLVGHELVSGEAGQEGARMVLKFKMGKNTFEMTETVTERNLPDMFAGKYESHFSVNTVRNRFIDLGDGKTKMVSETTVEPANFMVRLMTWIMPGSFKKQSRIYLENFRDFAEGKRDN